MTSKKTVWPGIYRRETRRGVVFDVIATVGDKQKARRGFGPYSPENCRWATQSEQVRNRRKSTRIGTRA